jgi:hypothetical protein
MARSRVSRFAVLGRPRPILVGAIAVLFAAGCGSSGPSGSVPSAGSTPATSSSTSSTLGVAGVDACSLVSATEASAVVGTVREPVPLSRDPASTPVRCDYVGQDPNTNSSTTVEVTVRTTTPTEFAARCANNGTAFPGIGDAACGAPKAFLLRKGTTEVDLTATTTLGAGQVTMNFSVLAKTIVTRL